MAKYGTIDEYIGALPEPLSEVAAAARRVIDANLDGAESAIKWAHPTWSLGNQPVCYLKEASKHVTFGFWRGHVDRGSVGPPRDLRRGDGAHQAPFMRRHGRGLFADWLRQARELEAGRA